MSIDLEKYFARIGYTDQPDVSVKTLTALHRAQVLSIPFENLAIHELPNTNQKQDFIHLDEASLFKKLVLEKRGGYCHENNELFALVLIQLGFKVDRLLATPLTGPNRPRGHKLLLVTIGDEKWIADVGFGGNGLYEPIPLTLHNEVTQFSDKFRFVAEEGKYFLQAYVRNDWKNIYKFDLEFFDPIDFEPLNYYVSHSPQSMFVKSRICVMPTMEGRIILNDYTLKIVKNGAEEISKISDEKHYQKILRELFSIELKHDLNPISTNPENERQTNSWFTYFKTATAATTAGLAMYLGYRSLSK